MKLNRVVLRHLQMEQKSPFTTSYGTMTMKDFILVEAIDEDGVSGWGESVAFRSPWYTEETLKNQLASTRGLFVAGYFETSH